MLQVVSVLESFYYFEKLPKFLRKEHLQEFSDAAYHDP